MPDTTGNFQDLLQFSQDTLYNLGEAFSVGNSAASTITYGFSNTGGVLQLAAAHTTNQTVWLPTASSGNQTLLTAINISAGTTSANLSAITFSNSNGVSFGLNGSTITASVNAGAGGGIAIADDNGNTVSNNTVQFSYPGGGNVVSFGLTGSTMTGSVDAIIEVGAGTTSNSYAGISFSNKNFVSFGLSDPGLVGGIATITASIPTLFVSVTNGNGFITNICFSDSNNVNFGGDLPGPTGTITAEAFINVSAGATSGNITAITFSNGSGVSFGFDGTNVTAFAPILLSAGTTSNNLSNVTFSNSNNVSFGLNGSTITASANLTNDWYDNIAADEPNASGSGAMGSVSNFTGSASSLFVAPMQGFGNLFPFDLTANTCFFPDVSISGSTATMSLAFTSVWYLGIYTLNASSLSLLNSVSVSFGFAAANVNNSTGYAGGFRYGTIPGANWSSSPVFRYGSRYWLAWFWSSAGALNQTDAIAGAFFFSSGHRSGLLGASNLTATSNGWAPFYGIYSAQTAALPANIGRADLQKTASQAGFLPHLILANNASLTVF